MTPREHLQASLDRFRKTTGPEWANMDGYGFTRHFIEPEDNLVTDRMEKMLGLSDEKLEGLYARYQIEKEET